jgi:hypothetical protein
MSVLSSAQEPPHQSDNAAEYREKLLLHAHVILSMGYRRLDSASLNAAEEEDITGALAEAMTEFLASPDSPGWRTYYAVHEEPRVRSKKRRGKRRLRLDIQVEFTGGSRPRFSFEAKRLRAQDAKSLSNYFGKEGLGCFVSGSYANDSDEAGMLGYIQSHSSSHWVSELQAGLKKRKKKCEWVETTGWLHIVVAEDLSHTYKSSHTRASLNKPLVVYHTLLEFVVPEAPPAGKADT